MVDIVCINNKDNRFYPLMGPFLARREVEKEIGYKIYDDDDKEWFVVLEGGSVIGFCYRLEKPKGTFQVGSCYTVEGHRRKGVFKKLLAQATKGISGYVHMTTRSALLRETLLKNGFSETGQRGSFTKYGREL